MKLNSSKRVEKLIAMYLKYVTGLGEHEKVMIMRAHTIWLAKTFCSLKVGANCEKYGRPQTFDSIGERVIITPPKNITSLYQLKVLKWAVYWLNIIRT